MSDLDSVDVVVMDEASPAVRELCAGYDIELITAIAMDQGQRFTIREGGRTVGSAVVAKIIE